MDEPDEPVTFITVAFNAVYQVPKEGVLCMKQVRTWKPLSSFKRLDAEGVVCKIIKQSLSLRDVSAGWGGQVCVI